MNFPDVLCFSYLSVQSRVGEQRGSWAKQPQEGRGVLWETQQPQGLPQAYDVIPNVLPYQLLSVSAPGITVEIPGASSFSHPSSPYLRVVPGISFIMLLIDVYFPSVLNFITEVCSIQSAACNLFKKNMCTCEHMYVCACAYRGQRTTSGIPPQNQPSLVSVIVPEFTSLAWAAAQSVLTSSCPLLALSCVGPQVRPIAPVFFWWVLGIKLRQLCFQGQSLINWAISLALPFQLLSGVIRNLRKPLHARWAAPTSICSPGRAAVRSDSLDLGFALWILQSLLPIPYLSGDKWLSLSKDRKHRLGRRTFDTVQCLKSQ